MDMADGMYYRSKFYMTGDDKIEMGDKMWVKPRFLTEQEIDMVFPQTPEERAELDVEIQKNQEEMQQDMAQATAAKTEEVKVEEPKPEVAAETVVTPAPEVVAKAEEVAAPVVETEKPAEPVVETKVPEAEVKANDETKPEGVFITEGERVKIEADRKELAEFRKEKKLAVIEKYSEYLSKDDKTMFSSKVDEFTIETLEAELAKVSMQKLLKQNAQTNVAGTYGFRTTPKLQQNPNGSKLAELVERYKGK
jgi:hypothetical protein